MELTMLNKLSVAKPTMQILSRFIEWLEEEKGIGLCQEYESGGFGQPSGWYPTHETLEKLIYEHCEIDLVQLENERRQLLEDSQDAKKA